MVELSPLVFRRATFDWGRTVIMGVVNVTPDSFSDGGSFIDADRAVARGQALRLAGADVVDVGGESTRPGAAAVTAKEEAARAIPVVRRLAEQTDAPVVSIDTYKAEVAAAAIAAGAEIVNDISGGLLDRELLSVAAQQGAAVILGHLRGTPAEMAAHARYMDIVGEVVGELRERVLAARAAGVAPGRILVDPGLGFAKQSEHNLSLLAHLDALAALGCPIVVGASRKSFLGKITGAPVEAVEVREAATAAAHTAAILRGAHMVRVHDVALQRPAVQTADAIKQAGGGW
jgi:dihydropteroate synthase